MDTRLQRGFTIGEYEVRPFESRIIGSSGSQHLQPKVLEVLLCLAENAGELVERERLIKHAWGDGVESDDVLTRCISELRHHFEDHRDDVRYIQTIPRRGYRLVADVILPESASSSQTAPPPTSASEEPRSFVAKMWSDLQRRNVVRVSVAYIVVGWIVLQVGETIFQALNLPAWTLTLLLALLMLGFPVAVLMAWVFQVTPEGVVVDVAGASPEPINLRRNLDIVIISALVLAVGILGYREFIERADTNVGEQPAQTAGITPKSSIAVLRFLNIGGESYFADGLGEELLDRLAQLRELGVAARTSSWALSDQNVDVPTIARRLQVDYVLEGSVRQSGDRIRITAQLNDGVTGMHVWSKTYDRELTTENFFETQSEIARQVASLLQISLSPESVASLALVPQTSMEALDYYLRGQEYFRMPHSDTTLDQAATMFQRSLEVDSRFAMAYAGLCDTQLGRYIISRKIEVFEMAERACHRALTLDEDMPRVLAALGGLYLFSGQNEKAEAELRRAITGNANIIDAYADLGEALENQGRYDEAEEAFLEMIARQPGYWYAHNALGNFLYRQAQYKEAMSAWTQVTVLAPDRALGFNNVASANFMLGDFEAASRAYEKSVEIEPYVDNYTNLGLAYYYAGQFERAADMQLKAAELRPDDARVWGRLANVYRFSGRADEARPHYETALELIEKQLNINPGDIRLNRFLAVYRAALGDLDAADRAIERAIELRPQSGGVWFDAAKIALVADDIETVFEYLEQSRELGYPVHLIRSDPAFEGLHDDERFALVTKE